MNSKRSLKIAKLVSCSEIDKFLSQAGSKLTAFSIQKLQLDIFYIDGKPVLHIVDCDTFYGSAMFVKNLTRNPAMAEVWEAFAHACALTYTGIPGTIQTDGCTLIDSNEFKLLLAANGIEHVLKGVESHHSNGTVENADHPLRMIFRKLKGDFPRLKDDLVLGMARKAMNDVSGSEGLPLNMLVYGSMPRARAARHEFSLPKNDVHFKVMSAARRIYIQLVNSSRIEKLLRKKVSPACDMFLNPGDQAYVWRQKDECYEGPFTALPLSQDKSQVELHDRQNDKKLSLRTVCLARIKFEKHLTNLNFWKLP